MKSLLEFGAFKVRSNTAQKRLQNKAEFVTHARYRFRGCEKKDLSFTDYVGASSENTELVVDNEGLIEYKAPVIFFEQTAYTFSIQFDDGTQLARVFSPLASWCENSDWDEDLLRLSIPINFANDVGDFELSWEWLDDNDEWHCASFSSQVYSNKLNVEEHFKTMLDEVQDKFKNWLRLDLLRQTQWAWTRDENEEGNQKTWLLIFQEVQDEMTKRFVQLTKQHRQKLMTESRRVRPERIRKMSSRLEEKVAMGLQNNSQQKYLIERKVLGSDTPENRYMKHLLIHTLNSLNDIIDRLEKVERVSDLFKERLQEWSDDWSRMKQNQFWKGIGPFKGLKKESLILSQDPIYASIRRSWILLQEGMSFLDDSLRG